MRAFFARDREIVRFRDGDGEVSEEEEESLSLAEAFFSAVNGCRGIMSSQASVYEGGFMLAK